MIVDGGRVPLDADSTAAADLLTGRYPRGVAHVVSPQGVATVTSLPLALLACDPSSGSSSPAEPRLGDEDWPGPSTATASRTASARLQPTWSESEPVRPVRTAPPRGEGSATRSEVDPVERWVANQLTLAPKLAPAQLTRLQVLLAPAPVVAARSTRSRRDARRGATRPPVLATGGGAL